MNILIVLAAWAVFYLIAIHEPGTLHRWNARRHRNQQAAARRRSVEARRAGGRIR